VTGHLAPIGAVEEMGDAAISILADTARWRVMSGDARRLAVERYGTDAIIPRYERYYERILAAPPQPHGGG
jgi:glycosyltransferase involved in cell wall biosynthesis